MTRRFGSASFASDRRPPTTWLVARPRAGRFVQESPNHGNIRQAFSRRGPYIDGALLGRLLPQTGPQPRLRSFFMRRVAEARSELARCQEGIVGGPSSSDGLPPGSAARLDSAARFEQEPGPPLRFVDPVFQQASGRDVVMLVTHTVYCASMQRAANCLDATRPTCRAG